MRKPENNPTERIGRLLEDVEKLEAYAKALTEVIVYGFRDKELPTMPTLEHVITERARRATTLTKVLANRRNNRRLSYKPVLSAHDLTGKAGG